MKLGSNDISSIYLGASAVQKVYLGDNLVWTSFTGLLDEYPNAAAAYSLRQLKSGITNAIRVRIDTTGQPEYNIGFVDGQLDTATLEGYCAGGLDAYVKTWYDQSGNGNDATQTTAANQPQIVSSGSVITENGKPAIDFDGSDDTLISAGEILNQSTFIGFAVVKNNRTSGLGRIFDQSNNNGGALLTNGTNNDAEVFGITSGGTLILTDNRDYNNQVLQVGQILSGNSKLRINAVNTVTDSTSFTMSGNTGIDFVIGDNSPPNGQLLNANLQEIVIYTTNQNSNISGIETNINVNYNIYWDGSQTSLLDTYSGAAAAYSLRALNSAYTGPLIRVRRTDGAEQDIYARYDGTLNTAALESFCSGVDGFVKTWYDQSGNGNNATQGTAANQPQIVSSGSVILENSKPTIDFDGSDDNFLINSMSSFSDVTIELVLANDTSNQDSVVIDYGFDVSNAYSIGFGDRGTANRIGSRTRISGVNTYKGADINVNNQQRLVTLFGDSTTAANSEFYLDNILYTDNIGSRSNTSDSRIGSRGQADQNFYDGNMQEVIIYNSDQSSNRTGIETNINDFYSIYS